MPDVRVVAGKYRLIAKLSEGGMGSVWSAEHLELNCPAAVKLLDPAFADSPEALARFKREAQSAASLRSTNIVQILDFGLDGGVPYIAMELLRGQTLAALLAEKHRLSPRDTATILSQVARAATWAHGMDIIHRDLKPGNIFLSEDAGETLVKLLDFGIAKLLCPNSSPDDNPVTMTGTIMGTPQYMSPEQASGRRAVDHRTDTWSFGIVAYECITGRRAFAADTLGGLMLAICSDPLPVPSNAGTVPKGFDEWFARCSHRDPGRRFMSIDEASDILRFVCGLEVNAAFSIPQLYSEPPLPPIAKAGSTSSTGPGAYATTASSTDAPSILTLTSSPVRPSFGKFMLFIGLFVTGVLVAGLFRPGQGSAARATAVAPASTNALESSHSTSDTRSLILGAARDAPPRLELQNPQAVPLKVALGTSAKATRDSRAQTRMTNTATLQNASLNVSGGEQALNPLLVPVAPPHLEGAFTGPPPAGTPATQTVETAIGLRRTTASESVH